HVLVIVKSPHHQTVVFAILTFREEDRIGLERARRREWLVVLQGSDVVDVIPKHSLVRDHEVLFRLHGFLEDIEGGLKGEDDASDWGCGISILESIGWFPTKGRWPCDAVGGDLVQ